MEIPCSILPNLVHESPVAMLNEHDGWDLNTDPESMTFFRTESHNFPYVQISTTQTSLTMHLYGRANWPSVALHFFKDAMPY